MGALGAFVIVVYRYYELFVYTYYVPTDDLCRSQFRDRVDFPIVGYQTSSFFYIMAYSNRYISAYLDMYSVGILLL